MPAILGLIEWGMVGAIASALAVIVALYFHSKNLAHTRLSNSAKMVLDLFNIFNSAEMRKHRSRFAQIVLRDASTINLMENAPVLEFFEEVGYMTKRGVLDKGMVWNSFFWWFEPYYIAVTKYSDAIDKARRESGSPTLFREVEWLYAKLCKVSQKEDKHEVYMPPSETYIRKFFEDENRITELEVGKPFRL